MKRYILAITGASGSIYGIRVLENLIRKSEVHLIISSQSFSIIRHETGIDWTGKSDSSIENRIRSYLRSKKLYYHNERNLSAPLSSGSFITDGMLVVPCSMKSLSGIANGYANNLTERAADVTIKEGRTLLLCPREMPFSAIHLENMLKLARLGVKIAPPVPAFYQKPKDLDDIVDFVTGKILDSFGIKHDLFRRWPA
ncbi:MAG TPA: UbiX family flavin prenyltransferase [Thermodesulfovibrionales bacterium]|nr:UbiX family flavin prenyltransferase [Thermodesulfovibrionales bacterium]